VQQHVARLQIAVDEVAYFIKTGCYGVQDVERLYLAQWAGLIEMLLQAPVGYGHDNEVGTDPGVEARIQDRDHMRQTMSQQEISDPHLACLIFGLQPLDRDRIPSCASAAEYRAEPAIRPEPFLIVEPPRCFR
jgi:hypothetical protein